MARIIDVNSNKKGLVRSVLVSMEKRPEKEKSKHELERLIDKIKLIHGSDEARFPTKKTMCWDNMSYLKESHMKLHHEGTLNFVHSELCLWRRTGLSN